MINIKLDAEELLKALNENKEEVQKELLSSVDTLALSTMSKIKELAQGGLSSGLRKIYLGENSSLSRERVQAGINIITLSGSAVWIDDGLPRQDMKTDQWLFKSKKTKTGKNGRYLVIPFDHSKKPSQQTGHEKNLTDRIKFELKGLNKKRTANGLNPIPFNKIENNSDGTPRLGKLHEFNFIGGKASQKWSNDPLDKLSVYQAAEKDKNGKIKLDKSGRAKIVRSFMTFRTASESTEPGANGVAPKDKFIYPGLEGKKYMEEAAKWAEETFYKDVLPNIYAKWKD